jgi:hypothetical protein
LRTAFDKCNGNFTELYGFSYQPLDADLTALAALAGIDVIYYRSGTDIWSPVTIGTGLSFASGTLTGTGGTSGSAEYTFSTSTSAPPASGQIRFNNATYSAVTLVWVHNITNGGTDIKRPLLATPIGTKLIIQEQNNSANYADYEVIGTPVDRGNYVEFPVTFLEGGTAIANNQRVLFARQMGASYAPINSPIFTGDPQAPTPTAGDNDTSIATTAFVKAQSYATITYVDSADALKAPLASPAFTGNPTAPTPTAGDNDTSIATTAFVQNAISGVGGGNVSNVGTPTNGQWAQWTDATHIQGVATAAAPWVQKAGDTMTGTLTIAASASSIVLNKSASGGTSQVVMQTAGSARWQLVLSDGTAESSTSTGSNFALNRYNNSGVLIDTLLTIARANGQVTLAQPLNLPGNPSSALQAAPKQYVDTMLPLAGGTLTGNLIGTTFSTTGETTLGNTSFVAHAATGQLLLGANAVAAGYYPAAQCMVRSAAGVWGMSILNPVAGSTTAIAFQNSGGSVIGSIDLSTTNTTYATTSDARLKKDNKPFMRGREIIAQLPVKDFRWRNTGEHGTGLIAQEVIDIWPDAVSVGQGEPGDKNFKPLGIDYSKYVPPLIQALQEAFRQIDELKQEVQALRDASWTNQR